MKCQSGKKIKGHICDGELQTKRTIPGPNGTVRRERFCPVCNTQQWTVEIFEDTLKSERAGKETEISTLKRKVDASQNEVETIKAAGQRFFSLINNSN